MDLLLFGHIWLTHGMHIGWHIGWHMESMVGWSVDLRIYHGSGHGATGPLGPGSPRLVSFRSVDAALLAPAQHGSVAQFTEGPDSDIRRDRDHLIDLVLVDVK